ncbi:MAG: flagellar motor switch phosphatase FliY [Peptococcaceae bacterium]|nr:flagellar motor switch phosphatase FliY [Peptococcaceae bacterium]
MADKFLEQEEVDMLMGALQNDKVPGDDDAFSTEERDALGEVFNIATGSAATSLSTLLNRRVSITSPRVEVIGRAELLEKFQTSHLLIEITFSEGMEGVSVLVLSTRDAAVVADLMMGGDGSSPAEELGEMEISAAAEAMNQMMGSAATAMATMFNKPVSISHPTTKILKAPPAEQEKLDESLGNPIVVVSFNMTAEDVINTEIMQLMSLQTAKEMAAHLLNGYQSEETIPAGEPAPEAGTSPSVETVTKEWDDHDTGGRAPDLSAPPAESPVSGQISGSEQAKPGEYVDKKKLDLILDIPLRVSVVLGRTRRPIKEVLALAPGSIVELSSLADEPVEILVNDTPVAQGEVVVVNENFGVRITNIVSPQDRVQSLRKE